MPLAMQADDLYAFLEEHFPQAAELNLSIEALDERSIRLRLPIADRHLRPGGTVSGPTMMWVGDCGMYLLVLARVGRGATQAVTTGLTMNFLRRPEPVDLLAEGSLLKLGRRLAVGEFRFFSEGLAEPVAQATLTYSIPSQ
jgi:acyl-coenzyme A thioesterase PaaI-like protein